VKIDYSSQVRAISGTDIDLEQFRDQVLLIVNTASRCGYTPQYAGLETLYQRYRHRGFSVLGFPCNQFGGQEPGSPEQIAKFCTDTYKISFPMFQKIKVNGPETHLLYYQLKRACPGLLGTKKIKWNFNKFLVSSNGDVLTRYSARKKPEDLSQDIENTLDLSSR
jgi:glutathione peroxidase